MTKAYKIIRRVLFSLILIVAGLYAVLYIGLSLPAVRSWIKGVIEEEFNKRSDGRLEIGELSVTPFSEAVLSDVKFIDAKGEVVAGASVIGAGININRLIFRQRIEITYAELIGLDARIVQSSKGAPLNIQFILDAFKSKEPKKEPPRFSLELNSVVVRRGHITFDREWIPRSADSSRIDFNHLDIRDIAADLRSPLLKNDDFTIDLRRLSFKESHSFIVESLSGKFRITPRELSFNDLSLRLPASEIALNDMTFRYSDYASMLTAFLNDPLTLKLNDCSVTPADFRAFLPALSNYNYPLGVTLDVTRRDGNVAIKDLNITSDYGLNLTLKAQADNLLSNSNDSWSLKAPYIFLTVPASEMASITSDFLQLSPQIASILNRLGDIEMKGGLIADSSELTLNLEAESDLGDIVANASLGGLNASAKSLKGRVVSPGFELGKLLANENFGFVTLDADCDLLLSGRQVSGSLTADVPEINLFGNRFSNLKVALDKNGNDISGAVNIADTGLNFDIDADLTLAGANSKLALEADVRNIDLALYNLPGKIDDLQASGYITADLSGSSLDDFIGSLEISDLHYRDSRYGTFDLDSVIVSARHDDEKEIHLDCDYGTFSIIGNFQLTRLPATFFSMLDVPLPGLADHVGLPKSATPDQDCRFTLQLYKDSPLWGKVKLPVTLLEDFQLNGGINTEQGTASVGFDIPYLQQGSNKLLRDLCMNFTLDNPAQVCNLHLSGRIPDKKGGYITLAAENNAFDGKVETDFSWLYDRKRAYRGNVSLTTMLQTDSENRPIVDVNVNPSNFEVNDTVWDISAGKIHFTPGELAVNNLRVGRQGQFALINGSTTANPDDEINVSLQNIDLDYIFDTLNIEYVAFGGNASGTFKVAELFSPHPRLYTDRLKVRDLTYNHSRLGDADMKSWFETDEKVVRLTADIQDDGHRSAFISGGIWVTRDSLSFDFDADRVNAGFLKPFVSAFCNDIKGRATGHAHLFGTFKDIDLTGKVYADNLKMRIDITNTEYTASDTVELKPGLIELNDITIYDRDGHTARLDGYVAHDYFHNPRFKFTVSDAQNFLCYDTNKAFNPIWYGTIYANGSGTLTGVPGFIDILVDMTSTSGSTFTFVLDDAEEAIDYEFLSFSDRRKEAAELAAREQFEAENAVPDFVKEFERKKAQQQNLPTKYKMDLRLRATPDARAIIVMDPIAGDRIRAYGSGPLRLTYNSEDELELFGTYTLERGDYNFTLQEVIVRDFKIREGSKITFTGDPLNATLDLTAAYRVNASLTDLDKSFSYDYDLNRNNVPVEALLKVSGPMQSPEIDFDIDLPTLNQDVVRKVRSIVSTSDMMNMQMVYLLALNRFYTPDYMNSDANNNEMASLASATVSTQLTNILGQLSDNWSFAPSFRTDKGDFSDMEVDLALSSNLLNNRLLFNGNLGYRDKATSSTTFVGDFDIEYLLNKSGSLRLKAYNHYNDQNYYLRSALTTQGIGIVYKRDFNHFLPGLFRRKKHSLIQRKDSVENTVEPAEAINSSKIELLPEAQQE